MLKKFVALVGTLAVSTVLVVGLSGCGGDKKPADPAPGTPPATPPTETRQ